MATARILVVDDEPDIRSLIKEILEEEGYAVAVAEDATSARRLRAQQSFDLILLDIWMPDVDGITLLKEWGELGTQQIPVVMLSGHGNVETAVEATRLGAYDFLEKPISLTKLLVTVQGALNDHLPLRGNANLQRQAGLFFAPVGKSVLMQRLRDEVRRVARHNTTVLFTGEPGTGKGVLAHYLHCLSERTEQPFIEVPVAALGEDAEAQLFNGPDNPKPGAFARAGRGTVFFSGVGELNEESQRLLYGALKTGQYTEPGQTAGHPIECRVLAATTRDLAQEVAAGRFRAELYYLLQAMTVLVPPLREHSEDVPELLAFYVDQLVASEKLPMRRFSMAAINRLRQSPWPGNVRELKNTVRRLLILGEGTEVELAEVERLQETREPGSGCDMAYRLPLRDARDAFEREYLQHLLKEYSGSVSRVAQHAGLERTHLYRKLRTLGIDPKEAAENKH